MKRFFPLLLLMLVAVSAVAAPVPSPTKMERVQSGKIITAAQWNATIPGIYTYINTVAAVLNRLTTKGDIYAYDGNSIDRLPAGSNTQAIVADSAQALGLKYAAPAAQQPMTTKGDIVYGDTNIQRLPVGADGNALGIVDGLPGWIDLTTSQNLPRGSVVPYNFTYAGSATVPTGWLVCDGTSGTPNLIGLFVIGAAAPGSPATAAPGGYGAPGADAAGTGAATHAHTSTFPSGTTGINPFNLEYNGAVNVTPYGVSGSDATVASPYHTHSLSSGSITVSSSSNEPSDYAMVYLVKQ